MKRVNSDHLPFEFLLVIVLFITLLLSSCNITENVALNSKKLIMDNLKEQHLPTGIKLKSDTSKMEYLMVDTIGNNDATGDFRYDNLYK